MTREQFENKWGYSGVGRWISKNNTLPNGLPIDAGIVADILINEVSVREGWIDRTDNYNMPADVDWEVVKTDVLTLPEYEKYKK